MPDDYQPQEYPKWIASRGVIVQSAEQERAVLSSPRAAINVVKAAQGDILTVKDPPNVEEEA